MDLFAVIAEERHRLADVLDGLDDAQWTTPSCCTDWTVEDVAAHLTVVWNYSSLDYARRAVRVPRTWFRPRAALAAVNAITVAERAATGRAAIVADLRAHAEDRTTPVSFGAEAPLTDLLMHTRDICLPLGIDHPIEPERVRPALATAVSPRFALFSTRKMLRRLRFVATDLDWSHGTGPEVTGPAIALAHAMWGRAASLGALDGDGVDVLHTRLTN